MHESGSKDRLVVETSAGDGNITCNAKISKGLTLVQYTGYAII